MNTRAHTAMKGVGFHFMIEKIVNRDGEKVTEIRSAAGKLLLIKTRKGYEIKCPRTKQICLIKYEEMISDCLACCDAQLLSKMKNQE